MDTSRHAGPVWICLGCDGESADGDCDCGSEMFVIDPRDGRNETDEEELYFILTLPRY